MRGYDLKVGQSGVSPSDVFRQYQNEDDRYGISKQQRDGETDKEYRERLIEERRSTWHG